ncbi:MAG: YwqG family protein [Cyanobacteria bacterium P01_C01_bin.69]
MDIKTLSQIASNTEPVKAHVDYLLKIAKPRIDIQLVKGSVSPENSRFGGYPFVPVGFQWPSHKVGEYRFLGQFNFAELSDPSGLLPASGLLSLFYAFDEDGEIFWRDDDYILGFYWCNYHDHKLFDSPTAKVPVSRKIQLSSGIDIPRRECLRDDWPFDEDALYELLDAVDATNEYLLGYPSFTSLGYDPTPGPGWISLLTVHSLDAFDWCWHDGDKLMVFVETQRLAECDFSQLKSDAG